MLSFLTSQTWTHVRIQYSLPQPPSTPWELSYILPITQSFWTQEDLTSYNKEKMSFALKRTYNHKGVSSPGGMASMSLYGTYKLKKYSQPKS